MPDTETAKQKDSSTTLTQATIRIPEELWVAVRKQAMDERVTAAEFCAAALSQAIAKRKKPTR